MKKRSLLFIFIFIVTLLLGVLYYEIGSPLAFTFEGLLLKNSLTGSLIDGIVHGYFIVFSTAISLIHSENTPFMYYQGTDYNTGLAYGVCLQIFFYTLMSMLGKFKKT